MELVKRMVFCGSKEKESEPERPISKKPTEKKEEIKVHRSKCRACGRSKSQLYGDPNYCFACMETIKGAVYGISYDDEYSYKGCFDRSVRAY